MSTLLKRACGQLYIACVSFWSNSSGNNGKDGEVWKYKIYFDPELEASSGVKYDNMQIEDFMIKLNQLMEDNEKIKRVETYKSHLDFRQFTNLFFHHKFVVFQTNNMSWSIEKNAAGITIQRSTYLDCVKTYLGRKHRWGLKNMERVEGRNGMWDLIEMLYCENELKKAYHYLDENCKDFADRVFEHMTTPVAYDRKKHRFIIDPDGTDNNRYKFRRSTAEEVMSYALKEMQEGVTMIRTVEVSQPSLSLSRSFLVYETKTCWWSVEKLLGIVVIRRFDSEQSLINRYIGFKENTLPRGEYKCIKETATNQSMYACVDFLCKQDN